MYRYGIPLSVNKFFSKFQRKGLLLKQVIFNRYLVFTGFMLSYTWVMSLVGGMPPLFLAWRLEIPLVLYGYFYLNAITRLSKFQAMITALPMVLAYGIFDINFLQLGRLLRIIELRELPELLEVLPVWLILLVVMLLGLILIAFIRQVRMNRVVILGALPVLIIFLMVEFAPDYFLVSFKKVNKSLVTWSDIQNAEDNGRISMMLYNEAKRQSNIRKMADYQDNPPFLKEMEDVVTQLNALKTKNNVHLIMLESFVDPDMLQRASFSQDPVHDDFRKIVENTGSLSISPVFGGGTAQAEFEVLCGVPSLKKLSGVEFDVFTGEETYCLPTLLAKSGFHTISSNAYKPDFFNSINAYKGTGFQNSYYPREYAQGRETYLSIGDVTDEKYMFDGDLLRQNLEFVTLWKQSNPGVPLFNYIMTIYGHLPYYINTQKRPMIIEVKGPIKDLQLERCINQSYYRTQAFAEFLNGIKVIDPESLVILISDHLPPVYGPKTYEKLGYAAGEKDFRHMNRVFFFENSRAVHYEPIHHYDIPDLILNYLTQGSYCEGRACNFKAAAEPIPQKDYGQAYMTIMANAMK